MCPVAMPAPPTRKPTAQAIAAATMARRGPPVSTQVPRTAADRPSITMAIENTRPTEVRLVWKFATRLLL